MAHKTHLKHTMPGANGPTCQRGRIGVSLRGEHMTVGFAEFAAEQEHLKCSRCASSKLFAFLARKAVAAA